MGLTYGIQIIQDALLKLCTGETFTSRVASAISQLKVAETGEDGDLTLEHYQEVQDIIGLYDSRHDKSVTPLGDIVETDTWATEQLVAEKIVRLGVDVIQENTVLQIEKDKG